MRQLLLLRHAKASALEAGRADRDRPLSPIGLRSAAAMRQTMRELGLTPDLVLVSPARRTMETLEALEPWDDNPLVEPLDPLYLATQAQLLAVLNGVAETVRSVLLIGHNPGLHELAVRLAAKTAPPLEAARKLAHGFPAAALAEFTIAGPWWQLDARGTRLMRFIAPSGP